MDCRKKILIIDDEEIVRGLLTEALSDSGFQVTTAENGPAGLDHFRKPDCNYDLVIVDMSMPVMDGPEVCKEIRKINPAQKIIIATGNYLTNEEIAELKRNGVAHIIKKPFNMGELISLLRSELGSS